MKPSEDGFTLLEVLVALTIAGLIGTASAGMSSFFAELESRSEARQRAMREVLAFRRLLQTSVETAFPPAAEDPDARLRNDGGQFELFSRGPAGLGLDRPRNLSFRIVRGGGTDAVEVAWQDPETGNRQTEIVLRGADRIAFSYLDRRGGKAVWLSTWSDPFRLPLAILAQLQIEELGGSLDIIARPVSQLPQACIALPHLPRCREVGS